MAGQITQHFLSEIKVHYEDTDGIVEDSVWLTIIALWIRRQKARSTSIMIDLDKV